MSRSLQSKEDGNRRFQAKDYYAAEALYSQAILADPKSPALYTNRALARVHLQLWESVIADCETCLALSGPNMKAYYLLGQAQLALNDFDSAIASARQAYEMCVVTNNRSLEDIKKLLLRCKKKRWEDRERRRRREAQDLETELLELLDLRRDDLIANETGGQTEIDTIREESAQKSALLRSMFDRARAASEQRREVPEWAKDDISFEFMVDPVITKTGNSYERSSIMEHLKLHRIDPLTRDPLEPSDLRPNLALRQACEEFLEENGWAADW